MILFDVDFSSYSASNWLRLQPIVHVLKSARYGYIDRRYRKGPARAHVLAERVARKPNLLISIAFEDAELADWQATLVKRYVRSAEYVVVDNSRSMQGAQAIRSVCEKHGCSYFLTPENPWLDAPSRSHGLALNWAFENIVKPWRPESFGFLDADIFPLETTDPFAPVKRQDFFGVIRNAESRWYLWAGFCFFRFSAVEKLSLNFGQAWFLGLDTGGGNWRVLYSNYDLSSLEHMATSFFPFKPGLSIADAPMQRCGPWIHEIGQMGRSDWAAEKRQFLRELLVSHLT